ncbi:MAG: hypothetical protein J2O47_05205 [Acidimicrobiaceae bacterium]|nr:hypothetical protein [Acidimicrobiaceae bacterium]
MPSNKWLDRTQPQTLVSATLLMYINAVLGLLGTFAGGGASIFGLLLLAGPVAAGWGIANEKKWGYWLGVVLTALALIETIAFFSGTAIITLLFYGALLALLLHPQSREYRKTWFRW